MSDATVNNAVSNPARPAAKRRMLEVRGLSKYFPIEKGILKRVTGHVRAVDEVTFHIDQGETLGLVGESGSGKTTLGRMIVKVTDATGGDIFLTLPGDEVINVAELSEREMLPYRKHIHMIFQDPYGSLNPRLTVLDIIAEPLIYNDIATGADVVDRVKELMELVGLQPSHLRRYPHAFSGGQRQRIGIARSLAPSPRLIVCDEAVSALDISVQAQVINLLQELQEKLELTYLFIAHDLSVVQHISDRVAVMYVGKFAELAPTEQLFETPKHPYTEALLAAVPKPDPTIERKRSALSGEIANPADPPSGCYFHPRCKYAVDKCKVDAPVWEEVAPEHFVACHRVRELDLVGIKGRPRSTTAVT